MCLELHIVFTTIMPVCHDIASATPASWTSTLFQDRYLDRVVKVHVVSARATTPQGCPLGLGAFVSALQNTWASNCQTCGRFRASLIFLHTRPTSFIPYGKLSELVSSGP
jgi:hypothetical protein